MTQYTPEQARHIAGCMERGAEMRNMGAPALRSLADQLEQALSHPKSNLADSGVIAAPVVLAPVARDVDDHMISALRWLLNITTEFDRKDVRTRQAARLLDDYSTGGKSNRELEAKLAQSAQPVEILKQLLFEAKAVVAHLRFARTESPHTWIGHHDDAFVNAECVVTGLTTLSAAASAQPVEVQRVPPSTKRLQEIYENARWAWGGKGDMKAFYVSFAKLLLDEVGIKPTSSEGGA